MTSWITVADAKAQTNISNAASDAELQGFVDAACSIVEGEVGPIAPTAILNELVDLQGRTVFNELTSAGPRQFVLRHRPILSIEAVGSAVVAGVSYTPSDFIWDPATSIVRRSDWGTIYGPLTVSYTVGYATPPPWAVLAAKFIVESLWASQRGPGRTRGGTGIDIPATAGEIPPAAALLLEPHWMTPSIG